MSRLLSLVGAGVGGWIGWAIGAHVGPMSAFVLSMIGTGVGLYAGRRLSREYFA